MFGLEVSRRDVSRTNERFKRRVRGEHDGTQQKLGTKLTRDI